jgi:hypothetical protein
MINLLPPQQKEELSNEKSLRMFLILGTLILSIVLSFSLVLLLIENYFLWDLSAQKVIFEEKEGVVALNQETEDQIREANSFLSQLNSFYQEKYDLTQSLERVYQALPTNTRLTKFNFRSLRKRKTQDVIEIQNQISLSGICPTREILLSFKDNLEKESLFSDVYFAPKSWVDSKNPVFEVTFNLK